MKKHTPPKCLWRRQRQTQYGWPEQHQQRLVSKEHSTWRELRKKFAAGNVLLYFTQMLWKDHPKHWREVLGQRRNKMSDERSGSIPVHAKHEVPDCRKHCTQWPESQALENHYIVVHGACATFIKVSRGPGSFPSGKMTLWEQAYWGLHYWEQMSGGTRRRSGAVTHAYHCWRTKLGYKELFWVHPMDLFYNSPPPPCIEQENPSTGF